MRSSPHRLRLRNIGSCTFLDRNEITVVCGTAGPIDDLRCTCVIYMNRIGFSTLLRMHASQNICTSTPAGVDTCIAHLKRSCKYSDAQIHIRADGGRGTCMRYGANGPGSQALEVREKWKLLVLGWNFSSTCL